MFSHIDVLVIDDWAIAPMPETERRDRLVHNAHRVEMRGDSMRMARPTGIRECFPNLKTRS
jgi:DNA replication protein DnaC